MANKKNGRPRTRAKPNRFDLEVGVRVKAAREKAGLSPTKAAEMMEKHLSTISRWEAGDVCIPTNMLAWMAKIYDCPVATFFNGVRPR